MKITTAQRFDTCRHCDTPVDPGHPIAQLRRGYQWIHAECALELQQMRRDGVSRRKELARLKADG